MESYVRDIIKKAKEYSCAFVNIDSKLKNTALRNMAASLIKNKDYIINRNKKDITDACARRLNKSFIERLTLNDKRLVQMSESLKEIARFPDPVNRTLKSWKTKGGLSIQKVSVPIGVILMIYEARPNVTSDSIGLMLKSSNVGILRGGADALRSNCAIGEVLNDAINASGIKFTPFFVLSKPQHKIVDLLLKADEGIDLVIPRGGEALIRKVVEKSRIPVIKHYKGVCNIFVDSSADIDKALRICVNAKVQRPSVCNAVETILIHKNIAAEFLPLMKREFDKHKVEIRGDKKTRAILKGIKPAGEADWYTEYLDLIISIKVVDSIEEAVVHINRYGSRHTDAIISKDTVNVRRFVKEVDSACCFVNISTRFSDGYEFGMGAEIGISTDKIHARGPMGLEELTSYKYIVYGNGQVRE